MGFMNLFSGLSQAGTAARAGYLTGQQQREERDYQRGRQTKQDERQASLDELRARLEEASINRQNAMADRYDRMNGDDGVGVQWIVDDQGRYVPMPKKLPGVSPEVQGAAKPATPGQNDTAETQTPQQGGGMTLGQPTGVKAQPKAPKSPTAPKVIKDANGALQWDAATSSWKRIGNVVPTPHGAGARGGSSGASQDRINANTALTKAEKNLPHPSKVPEMITNPDVINPKPGVDIRKLPPRIRNPEHDKAVKDSIAYEHDTLEPLRKTLYDATVPKLRLNGAGGGGADARHTAVITNPVNQTPADREEALARDEPPALGSSVPATSSATGRPRVTPATMKQAQAEFDAVGQRVQVILNSPNISEQEKAKARQLLAEKTKEIAKKYGLIGGE